MLLLLRAVSRCPTWTLQAEGTATTSASDILQRGNPDISLETGLS